MAIPEEPTRILQAGNGTRGPFTLSLGGTAMSYSDSSEIRLTRFDDDGVPTILVEGSDYTLSADSALPEVGETVQTVVAATYTLEASEAVLAADERILAERTTPPIQNLILTRTGGFRSAAAERNFDVIIRMVQELAAQLGRVVTTNALDSDGVLELPRAADRANKFCAFDDDGDIEAVDSADFVGDTGPPGADGALWFVGTAPPSNGVGENGDYYLVVSGTGTGDVYGPKAAGAWPGSAAGNIRGASGAGTGDMLKSENLSGLANYTTARSNLGLGSAALLASSAVFQVANNLSEGTASTMRSNLGLGSAALLASSAVLQTANNLSDLASASTARTNLGLGTAAILAEMTTAQYLANTADKVVSTDQMWAAGALTALSDGATIAVDMSLGVNFSVTLGGNRTLGNPSNTKVGQTGAIVITQDGTGSRTLAYAANWEFAGGTAPVLSTAPGAKDVLYYWVQSSGSILASLTKAWS